MKAPVTLIIALVALAGCASTSLPYQPDPQPSGAKISAGYQLAGDRLRIEVNTDGRQLEEAKILKANGAEVPAMAIDNPRARHRTTSPAPARRARGPFADGHPRRRSDLSIALADGPIQERRYIARVRAAQRSKTGRTSSVLAAGRLKTRRATPASR